MEEIKAFDFLTELREKHPKFDEIITRNMLLGKIRYFGEEEWNLIRSQNFIPLIPGVKDFMDMFVQGYNKGNCAGMSYALSYSYNDVDIVSGILPILKGTLNAEKEGGHVWLERPTCLIDTSLMLVMDKSIRDEIGYIEEQRITSFQLGISPRYQSRKEFVNDKSLRGGRSK